MAAIDVTSVTAMLVPSLLPDLEAKVLSPEPTEEAVLRAVLKQYAFRPKECKQDVVNSALAKALTLLPGEVFLQCLYLLPSIPDENPTVTELCMLENLLQMGNFTDAWKLVRDPGLRSTLDKVAGFDDSLRSFIASALEVTYSRCPLAVAMEALSLGREEAAAFRTTWKLDGADVIVFPARPDNQPRTELVSEPVSYEEVAEMVKSLSI